jgi:hypothetical protein
MRMTTRTKPPRLKIETECLECGERSSHLNVVRNSLRYHANNYDLQDMLEIEGDTLVILMP